MDVRPRANGLTTTESKNQRKCQICWAKGEAVYYQSPNGKLVCGKCIGLPPGTEPLIRRVD